jgi:hypothetical protein
MNVEQTLTDELRVVADLQAPPPPSVAEVSRMADHERGRARRTRLAVAGLVAAAVVAAVVVGTQVGHPSSAPQPMEPSPSYYADGVPYYDHGGLYIDHQRQPGEWFSVESAGEYSVAVAADQTAEILHDGKQVMQIDGFVHQAALSFDGTKAAWIAADGQDKGVLVVRDLVASRDLGRLPLVLKPKGDQGIGLSLGIRNDGTAYYQVNDQQWRWQPGAGAPVRARQMPNTVQTHPAGFDGVAAPVRLSPDHLWGAWVTDPDGPELADTEGKALGVTVQKPGDPGSRFTMPRPTGLDLPPIVFWDTPTELTFAGPENLRCNIADRGCRVLGTS